MDLNEITKKFDEHNKAQKKEDLEAKNWRLQFFLAADEIAEEETLARQTIEAPLGDGLDEYIERFYPGWRFVDETDEGRVIIEEDPRYKPFVHTNEELGLVFQRQVSQKSPQLDDERLREEDPELWERITEPTRVPTSSKEWSPEDIAEVRKYMVPGRLELRMASPRKPKDEET